MQLAGALLATLGTTLIVVAALQAGAAILGDSFALAVILATLGAVLMIPGAWLILNAK